MGAEHRKAVLDVAEDADAWILSDEVYLGAEREGPRTETLWGTHDKTLVVNGLSKAYGLPGLRIGWLVGPPRTIAAPWAHPDSTTIGPPNVSAPGGPTRTTGQSARLSSGTASPKSPSSLDAGRRSSRGRERSSAGTTPS